MGNWKPASREAVESLLASAVDRLHPAHRPLFAAMRVPLRSVPIAAHPGERVWVVAEHEGGVLETLFARQSLDAFEVSLQDRLGAAFERCPYAADQLCIDLPGDRLVAGRDASARERQGLATHVLRPGGGG